MLEKKMGLLKDISNLKELAFKSQKYSGLDDPKQLLKRQKINVHGINTIDHFNNYEKEIYYSYNSRGFRDNEWPQDLINTPIIFGDSFILGLGQPKEERLSDLLKAINFSMDGASNDWISRNAIRYLNLVRPTKAVVSWSYIQRRENKDNKLSDTERRLPYINSSPKEDLDNLYYNMLELEKVSINNSINLVHIFVPGFARVAEGKIKTGSPNTVKYIKQKVKKCVDFHHYIDYARDGHHYDILTAMKYKNEIEKLWQK